MGTKAIYVWDDDYFRQTSYSLKRLVFIYETLCELPVDIIRGDTRNVVVTMAPSALYVPSTNNPSLLSMFNGVQLMSSINFVDDDVFAVMKKSIEAQRFFQYWNKVEKSAFLHNGGAHT